MRATHRCTKCACSVLYHIPETGHDGLFEMFVCADCGYSETFVRGDARKVLRKVQGVEKVVGGKEPGPYR